MSFYKSSVFQLVCQRPAPQNETFLLHLLRWKSSLPYYSWHPGLKVFHWRAAIFADHVRGLEADYLVIHYLLYKKYNTTFLVEKCWKNNFHHDCYFLQFPEILKPEFMSLKVWENKLLWKLLVCATNYRSATKCQQGLKTTVRNHILVSAWL